jgi:type II secretory pathway pseudopilin PulG
MKTVYQIALLVAIVLLSFFIYESIMTPIRFNKEKDKRYAKTIERLKDIRTAQIAYRSENNKFTGSFDTLINFIKNEKFNVIRQIGSMDDSVAVAKGLVRRDTVRISVLDSLFKKGYPVDSLRYVPFTGGAQFEMGAGDLPTGSGLVIKVFEAKVHNDILLKGLDRQLVVNLNDLRKKLERYPGLQVGSLTQATNHAGNWE